jgi:hypothetical protein
MALTKITSAIIEDGAITASALSDNSIGITQLNVSDGTSGQFLKTDGSGNLSFASVPAGYTDSDVDTKLAAGVGNILTTGYIAGPATFTIDPAAVGDNTGTVVIAGNLQVDGTTTTINSTTMTVDDLNITLASGAANAAAANGAGITVDGASATITYDGTNDEWDFNKDINVTGTATMDGLTVAKGSVGTVGSFSGDNASGGRALEIIASTTTNVGDTHTLNAKSVSGILKLATTNTARMGVFNSGIGFYEDTGTTLKFFWDASAESLGIGTSSPSSLYSTANQLVIGDGSADVGMTIYTPSTGSGRIFFADGLSSGDQYAAFISYNHALGSMLFGTGSTGTTDLSIDSNGNVGIGTDDPNALLHIKTADPATNQAVIDFRNPTYGIFAQTNSISTRGNTLEFIASDYNNNSPTTHNVLTMRPEGNVGIGTSDPKSTLQIEGGRMGIISTDSSWGQLRIANPNVAEAGIAIMNGATNTEFLSDTSPSFSNAFTLAIHPYGCGTDTLAIGHGALGDSIWHIDGSGNFGYGPNTENPVSYYEISKTRPNVNQPSDYELKMTLNTYGYVGSGYKLGMLQFLGGDTAGAQDNFYAGIGSTALDGVNNSEEGSLDFHVYNGVSSSETLAVQIIGKAGAPLAGAGQVAKSTLFRYQGIAIDRVWANYPGISVLNSSDAGTNQGEFRFHGTNSASASYPAASGSDFSVDVRADGSFISTSDRRAKINITTIDNALSKVNQLTGKRFQRINRENQPQEHLSKNGYKFGFIAQEIEDIIPEAVKYHANEDDGTENWNSSYAMDYGSVVALLVNAIKEQQVLIEAQATTITDLTTRIETLEG